MPCIAQVSHISDFTHKTCALGTVFWGLAFLQWDFVDSELRNTSSVCLQDPKCKGPALSPLAGGDSRRETAMYASTRFPTASWARCLTEQLYDEAERITAKIRDLGQKKASCKNHPTKSFGNHHSKALAFA